MQVRHATTRDATDVLGMVQAKAEFDRELGAFTGELGTNEELIRRHLFGPRPIAFALLAGPLSKVAGFALYYFRYSSFNGRPSLWLDDLYVHAPFRRQGTGGRLMHRLAQLAVDADCTHIAWTARSTNTTGMAFYNRIGATIIHQAGTAVTLQVEPAALLSCTATGA
jgi:GNAT superfamily N-acetyltransferase